MILPNSTPVTHMASFDLLIHHRLLAHIYHPFGGASTVDLRNQPQPNFLPPSSSTTTSRRCPNGLLRSIPSDLSTEETVRGPWKAASDPTGVVAEEAGELTVVLGVELAFFEPFAFLLLLSVRQERRQRDGSGSRGEGSDSNHWDLTGGVNSVTGKGEGGSSLG